MRYAVKDRPVEEFDTDLQLPEWQLEPDDEYMFGDPEDYYFIDEQGNLIEPGTADTPRNDPFAQDFDRTLGPERPNPSNTSQPGPGPRPPQQPPRGADGAPQAIGDDFLEEATGASGSNRSPPAQRQIN
ncbi:MAG TPA: penicillin-binding protein, partial [Erythrobacter sp.]|nr:penicillin-binding protein [Erythrobacter sp.]HAV81608.1 penicillin-binding protein [Erythrobacter sp.]